MRANVQGYVWLAVRRGDEEFPYGASTPCPPDEGEDIIARVLNNSSSQMPVVRSIIVTPNTHAVAQGWQLGFGPLDPNGLILGPTRLTGSAQAIIDPTTGNLIMNVRVAPRQYAEFRIPAVWALTDTPVYVSLGPESVLADVHCHIVTGPASGGYPAVNTYPAVANPTGTVT